MHAVAAFFASIITFVSGFFAPPVASNSPTDIQAAQPAAAAAAQTEIIGDPFNDPAAASAVAATISTASAPALSPPPTQTVINQPVIERIIERFIPQGAGSVSTETLAAILADFEQSISNRISALNPPKAAIPEQVAAAGSITGAFFPASQRIDQLTNTAINTPTITGGTISGASVSGYLPLSGGTLTGTLSGTDLNLSGALTAGALNVSSISSAGALTGPYFTATSTTATSSFAGGLTVGTSQFVVQQASGNVGIGTTSPATLLSVAGNGYFTGGLGVGSVNTTAGTLALAGTSGTTTIASGQGFTIGGSQFVLQQGSGNIGIGTTSPTKALDIVGDAIVGDGQANGAIFFGGVTASFPKLIRSGTILANYLADGSAFAPFQAGLLTGNGAVTTTGPNSGFVVNRRDNSAAAFNIYSSAGDLQLYSNALSGDVMRVTSTGNVGINNTSPSYKLDVGGFINTDGTAGGYKLAGNTVLYASTTNTSLALGASAAAAWMSASSTTWNSVAVGPGALATTPTSGGATYNVGVGYLALNANTTGDGNTAAGSLSLLANTTGIRNVGLGMQALYSNTTGSYNTALGNGASVFNTTGSNNVAIGSVALQTATSSSNNTAVGYQAGNRISGATGAVGGNNSLFGYQSGYDITTGGSNTILGQFPTTGSGVTTGSNNILIGNDVRAGLSQTGSNQLNIGNLIFGTSVGTGATLGTGNVGIGTTTPGSKLHIQGSTGADFPLIVQNDFTGDGATAALELRNRIAVQNSLRMLAIGQGFTTQGAFTQNAGVISAEVSLTGGLNLLTRANAPIRFYTNSHNNERMRITEGGNVGIGTTNPGSKLEVQGTAAFQLFNATSTTGTSTIASGQGFTIGTSQFVLQQGSGFVGIGTNAPAEKLEVAGFAKAGFVSIGGTSNTSKNYINLGSDGNATLLLSSNLYLNSGSLTIANSHSTVAGAAIKIPGNAQTRQNNIEFWTTPTGSVTADAAYAQNSPRMVIDTSGNVGIGTTSPYRLFSVAGTAAFNASNINLDNSTGSQLNYNLTGRTINEGVNSTGQFFINDATAGATRLLVNTNGNVGIGDYYSPSNLPQNKLSIAGSASIGYTTATDVAAPSNGLLVNGNVGIGTTTPGQALVVQNTNHQLSLNYNNTTRLNVYSNASQGVLQAQTDGVGYNALLLNPSGGNVGIGTTSPNNKLDVSGWLHLDANGSVPSSSSGTGLNLGYWTGSGGYGIIESYDRSTSTAKPLEIYSSVLRIPNGNVGIGTTTPEHTLDVNRYTSFRQDALLRGGSKLTMFRSNVDAYAWSMYSDPGNALTLTTGVGGSGTTRLSFSDSGLLSLNGNLAVTGTTGTTTIASGQGFTIGGSQFVVQQGSGNVGIGTISPSGLGTGGTRTDLQIHNSGTDGVSFGNIALSSASTGNGAILGGIQFGSTGLSGADKRGVSILALKADALTVDPVADLAFFTANGGTPAERMRILANGNIGIGTTSPLSKFTVEATNPYVSLNSSTAGKQGALLFYDNAALRWQIGQNYNNAGDGNLYLYRVSGSGNILLAPDGNGNVGIGTTTPSYKLDVFGNVRFGNHPTNNLVAGQTGYGLAYVGSQTAGWSFGITSDGGTTFPFTVGGSNIGIGTTSPTAQLHTTGTVRFSNFGAGSLQTDANGNVSVSSDERLKHIDGAFGRGLADIVRLNPINYHWNVTSGLETSTQYAGFSAQNVQQAIPEAVGQDSHGYLTLQDRPLIATVVNAIKELAQQFTDLAERVTTKELTFDRARGIELDVEKLCIGSTCLTEQQIKAILAATGQDAVSPSTSAPAGTLQAPVIELNGNASSTIELGATYNDLGARIVAPESDLNLGIVTVLDGATTSAVSIDTSTPGEHTISYTVTSPTTGLTGNVMRTIIIAPAGQPPASIEDTNPFNTPANDNASSTATVDAAA
jgi:hypothetical protein